jgi:hypothetical protein
MQIECMSSEESDFETDVDLSATPRASRPLQTRGYGWRSTRLLRFFAVLDVEDSAEASNRPKRGSGRRERFTGPHKEGFHLPPKGVASWMVSQRWMFAAQVEYPDVGNALEGLVMDVPGFDWSRFSELGNETEDEETVARMNYATSSLHCALA